MLQPGQLAGNKAVRGSGDGFAVEVVVHVELICVPRPATLDIDAKVGVGGRKGARDVDVQSESIARAGGLAGAGIKGRRIYGGGRPRVGKLCGSPPKRA